MRSNRSVRSIGRTTLAAMVAGGVLVLGSAPALADEAVDGTVESVEGAVGGTVEGEAPQQTPEQQTPESEAEVTTQHSPMPVDEDDDPDKEMTDPVSPDHASAENAEVEIADNDVAAIGQTDATIGDDDSASADATALSLGGNEIIGAHAEGNESNSAGDPLQPICEGSDGSLCAQVLYAEANSSEQGGAQESSAHTAVVNACVGGTDTAPEDCDGPVGASVLTSDSEIDRGRDGHTAASSSSSVVGVCLEPDPITGECTVGAEVLSSEGESHSSGTASKDSQVVGLSLPAEFDPLTGPINQGFSDPMAIELPPECPAEAHIACLYLNQGETYSGSAGHAITTLDATLLNGNILALISHTETLVHKFPAEKDADGGAGGGGAGGPGQGGSAAGPAAGQAADGGVLPNTGGVWTGLLSLALLGLGLGSLLVAWSRRSMLDHGIA